MFCRPQIFKGSIPQHTTHSQSSSCSRCFLPSPSTVFAVHLVLVLVTSSLKMVAGAQDTCDLRPLKYAIRLRHRGHQCRPKEIIGLGCHGTCSSYSKLTNDLMNVQRTCKCCKGVDWLRMTVRIECPYRHGSQFRIKIKRISIKSRPSHCMCRTCHQEPQNLIAAEFLTS